MTNNNSRSNHDSGRSELVRETAVDAHEVVERFWRRRWLIASLVILVLGAFAWQRLTRVPEYQAVGQIQVIPEEPAVPGLAIDVPVARLPVDPVSSEVEVLRSRTLLDAVVDSLGLQLTLGATPLRRSQLAPDLQTLGVQEPGEYVLAYVDGAVEIRDRSGTVLDRAQPGAVVQLAGFRFTAAQRPAGYPDEVRFRIEERRAASDELYERLSAASVERTNLVNVSYRDYDPELAAQVLNTIMELARRQSIQRLRQQASARREFIEDQLIDFERQLLEAQAEVQRYQEEIGAVSAESEETGQIDNILAFERQVEELRLERDLYAPVFEGMEAGTVGEAPATKRRLETLSATPALVKNPAIGNLYRRLVALEVTRDSLVSGPGGAGPGNYAVQALDEQIETTGQKLVEALAEYIRGLDRQIVALRSTIARLRRETEQFLPHAAELTRRQQRVESLRRVYETLQAQLEQTRIEEAAESGQLAIIDPAVVMREPINSTRVGDVLLAIVLAGIVGFGTALVLDYFDDRVRSPREVRRSLGLTVLGVVPQFDPLSSPVADGRAAEKGRVHLEPQSAPAECYRVIRTNLSFSLAVKPRRSILITSPGPMEGKTTTATNLAVSLSQQGARTLLLDADLRKGSVNRLLEIEAGPGLTGILTGEASVDSAIVAGAVDGLDVIPSGPLPPNPAELLGAERMGSLLATLSERYDRVLVDSPPVLAVSDPCILAQQLDAALVVIRANETGRQALLDAVERLNDVGGDVLGVVVNALRAEFGYGSSYYYYRDGYYGERGRLTVANRIRRLVGARRG